MRQLKATKTRPVLNDQSDDIIECLNDAELDKSITEVDFSLSNVENQLQEMEKEIRNAKFSNPIKLAADKTYLNSNLTTLNVELNDEEVYNLVTPSRKVEILENFTITIGNQFFGHLTNLNLNC